MFSFTRFSLIGLLCISAMPIQGMGFARRFGGSVAAATRTYFGNMFRTKRVEKVAQIAEVKKMVSVYAENIHFFHYPRGNVYGRNIAAVIAHTQDNMIGQIVYGYPESKFFAEQRTGNINLLAVDRSHRQNGLGSALLQQAIVDMQHQGISKISLYACPLDDVPRHKLVDFYEKHGFEKCLNISGKFDGAMELRFLNRF